MNSLRTSGEYERLMIGVFVICGSGAPRQPSPGWRRWSGRFSWCSAVAGLLLAAIWWAQRWLREYREDRADIAHVNAVSTARALAEQRAHAELPVGGDR